MRIALAGPVGIYGGLEVHTSELYHFLAAHGHTVLRIQVRPDKRCLLNKAAKLAFWATSCIRVLFFRPDLLISVGIGRGYKWLSKSSGRDCFRVQQIVTDDFGSHPDYLRTLLHSFDAIGAQTPTLMQELPLVFGPLPHVAVLPCFHQIPGSISANSTPPPLANGIRLAYFGRLAGNKGLPLLLQAVRKLRSPLLVALDLWGTGPVLKELENLLRQYPEIRSTVTLKGRYPAGQEYIELLASYHGLVLPSQACEGLPLVLLEAASVGLPVLSTRIGGIQDFARSNPDALTVGLGLAALCEGLEQFLSHIHKGSFQRQRQQAYFAHHYSRPAIEKSWSALLKDSHTFLRLC
jgi:glycosyltransferase involved in cell wall biosynthesis